MRRQNLAAFSQSVAWDDKHQNSAGLQPAVRVAQEYLLSAATFSRPQCPIIGWIQIQEAKALDWALHFQRVSVDNVGNLLPGLLSAVGIKLDAVAQHFGVTGNCLEGYTIANTRIKR